MAAVAAFVLVNLAVPLFVEDFFPFTTTPMFRDRPQYYSAYSIDVVEADSAERWEGEKLTQMRAALALHRTYDGNPAGLGVGQVPPPTLDRFTDTLAEQSGETEVRRHVQARLDQIPKLAGVEVVQEIVGPQSNGKVGVVRTNRWRVMRSGAGP